MSGVKNHVNEIVKIVAFGNEEFSFPEFLSDVSRDFKHIKAEFLYHSSQYVKGIKHGLRFSYFLEKIKDNDIKQACIDSTKLILGLFIGSLIIYNVFLLPFLKSQYGENYWIANLIFEALWNCFWILPSYIATLIYSIVYFDKISNGILKTSTKVENKQNSDILKTASEIKTFLPICMGLTNTVLSHVPYIGIFLSYMGNAWLYSFYSFEYRWNKELKKSPSLYITYIQHYWSYFLGFGTLMSLLTFRFSTAFSFGVFSAVFPYYLIMTFHKNTFPEDEPNPKYPKPDKIHVIRVFEIPEYMYRNALKIVAKLITWERKMQKLDN